MKTNALDIHIFNSVAEAPNYRLPEFKAAELEHACVVRKGTEEGRSTVDLIFKDESGQKYITLLTGRLITMLASAIGDEV